MLVVGIGSGMVGYIFGQQSLKGITQPALNPFLKTADARKQRSNQGITFAKERDILAKVKAQTSETRKPSSSKPKPKPSPKAQKSPKVDPKPSESPSPASSGPKTLPITVEDQGMNFEVRSVVRDADGLVLNVALTNQGSKPLQFLYTFLDVTDDQGQVLFAEPRGLPAQLQPKSDTYLGTIKIVDVPEDSVEQLSLKLTDYPNQTLNLVLEIPVPKE